MGHRKGLYDIERDIEFRIIHVIRFAAFWKTSNMVISLGLSSATYLFFYFFLTPAYGTNDDVGMRDCWSSLRLDHFEVIPDTK